VKGRSLYEIDNQQTVSRPVSSEAHRHVRGRGVRVRILGSVRMKNIFAITEQVRAPAYASLNDRDGTLVLNVRSRGESGVTMPVASIVLGAADLAEIANGIQMYLAAKEA
jgi:hypothetical protein